MKNYSTDVISRIQEVIDTAKLTDLTVETFPKIIYANGVKASLVLDNERPDALITYAYTFNRDDVKEWRKEGFGKFLIKDWKKGNVNLYKELIAELNSDITIKALIRDVTDEELEEPEYYADLTINDRKYCIIKAFVDGLEMYALSSHLEEVNWQEKIIMQYTMLAVEDDAPNIFELKDADSVADDAVSEELF